MNSSFKPVLCSYKETGCKQYRVLSNGDEIFKQVILRHLKDVVDPLLFEKYQILIFDYSNDLKSYIF